MYSVYRDVKTAVNDITVRRNNESVPSGSLPTFRRVFAESGNELRDAIGGLVDVDAVGLDVEMAQRIERLPGGVTRGKQLLALIQIAGGDLSLVIDPLRVKDLSILQPLLASAAVKVVLGGATDVQLLEERKLAVHNIADLAEVAVSVFGHKEEGMRALADRALGIQIDKSIRREDWFRRPINPAMLNYAHRDAELTLLLYRWFQEHHHKAVVSHTRKHFQPVLPASIPEWIRKYLTKRIDALRVLKEVKIDPESSSDRLVIDVKASLKQDLSPGQQRRLIRLIGELRMKDMFDEVVPYASSPSSVFRSAAARALGRMDNEDARPILQRLLEDHIQDVVSAAQLGLRDLNAGPEKPRVVQEDSDESPTLKPEALAVLHQMRGRLDSDLPESSPE